MGGFTIIDHPQFVVTVYTYSGEFFVRHQWLIRRNGLFCIVHATLGTRLRPIRTGILDATINRNQHGPSFSAMWMSAVHAADSAFWHSNREKTVPQITPWTKTVFFTFWFLLVKAHDEFKQTRFQVGTSIQRAWCKDDSGGFGELSRKHLFRFRK